MREVHFCHNTWFRRQFTQCKFLHQTINFYCGSAFLLRDHGVPAPETANFWNQVPECHFFLKKHKLLSGCVYWQKGKPVKVVTKERLAQVNAFCNCHFQTPFHTPQCTQSKLNMATVCWCEFKRSHHNFRRQTTLNYAATGSKHLAAPMVCHYKVTPPTTD